MKIGTTELIIILVVVLLIFGPSQIPKLSKMFGKSVKNLREGMAEDDNTSVTRTASADQTDHTDTTKE